jgi:AcrR family transcriptional regulator
MRTSKPTEVDLEMKLLIFNATNQLIQDKTLDSLTVKDICAEAHIARQTFYHYFATKLDVFLWHITYLFEIGNFRIGRNLSIRDGLYVTLKGMYDMKPFYLSVTQAHNSSFLKSVNTSLLRDTFTQTLIEYRHVSLDERLFFQLDMYLKFPADYSQVSNRSALELIPHTPKIT